MRFRLCYFFIFLLFSQLNFAQNEPSAYAADTESIASTMTALYDVISGTKEEQRDWDRFKNLFLDNARLIGSSYKQDGSFGYRSMSPEEYIEGNAAFFETRDFFEIELHREVDVYDNIVQVFSTYALKFEKDGEPAARGINSIQLLHDGNRWWICSILWEQESKQKPIPKKNLGSN